MADGELAARLTEHLPLIDRVARTVSRRHGMSGADAEDCASWVKLRLVENDYAILRKFRGASSLATYLTVAVSMLVRDYGVQRRGRWRPSAAARRLGALAMLLETMVYRDGMPLRQAGEQLRTRGATDLSDRELGTLLHALPRREPLRPIEVPIDASDDSALSSEAAGEDSGQDWEAMRTRLSSALSTLPAEDQLILRMRFWDGLSVADIARGLQVQQKPLYRRLERALSGLRRLLEPRDDDPMAMSGDRDLVSLR